MLIHVPELKAEQIKKVIKSGRKFFDIFEAEIDYNFQKKLYIIEWKNIRGLHMRKNISTIKEVNQVRLIIAQQKLCTL